MKLGAIEILTGPNSRYGIAIQRGFDLALADINKAAACSAAARSPSSTRISAGAKEQALNAARKLIGRDKVPLILGPTLSNEMFAAGPVANERKVPIVGTSTTANGITAIGPYGFRTSLPESDVIPVTLKTAKDKFGIKRVAVMYGNDDAFTKSAYDVMKASLEKLGIETLTTETFGAKDSDFSAQLHQDQGAEPGRYRAVGAGRGAASGIELQARQLGIPDKVFFIGGNGLNSPKARRHRGKAADGTLVGSPWFIGKPDAANQAFVNALRTSTAATCPTSSRLRPTTPCTSSPRRSTRPARPIPRRSRMR